VRLRHNTHPLFSIGLEAARLRTTRAVVVSGQCATPLGNSRGKSVKDRRDNAKQAYLALVTAPIIWRFHFLFNIAKRLDPPLVLRERLDPPSSRRQM